MNLTQFQPITILLDSHAHRYAKQFAREQINPAKGKQVYLNTLAVYGVHTYLKCLNIESNIAHSDCWQQGKRSLFNVADIILPNLGKLECLSLLPGESEGIIPLEVRSDRLGYLAVQLTENLNQIELLGFIRGKLVDFTTESINIAQLQPLETLFDAISEAKQQTNLSRWLSGIFAADWQPIETILAGRITRSLTTANKTTIARGKTIQWQLNSLEQEIILVLQMKEESVDAIALAVQLYPGKSSPNLPPGLAVSILDEADRTCLSAQTKETDDWVQLEFTCQPEEEFKIQINLAGVSIIEYFALGRL